MKKMLDKKLAELSGERVSGGEVANQEATTIEVAKRHSTKDIVLWLFAIVALIFATLVNQYLPAYWQPASDVWVRVGIITGLVVSAFIALALTNQGSAFKILLVDARIELSRVTWPSKQETLHYTWQVLVMTAILAVLVWLLDSLFNEIVKFVISG